jgi:hypothetical protein
MITHIKWIVIGIILLGLITLFIWGDKIQPGSIFAGLAAFIAAIKSKLFGKEKLAQKTLEIHNSHKQSRSDWAIEKMDYDMKFQNLKTRLDSLDKKIEELKGDSLSGSWSVGKEERGKSGKSEKEILEWLNTSSPIMPNL